jgi:hypothetical protein
MDCVPLHHAVSRIMARTWLMIGQQRACAMRKSQARQTGSFVLLLFDPRR